MAAFAKPLLCAGRFISTKFNLKTMTKEYEDYRKKVLHWWENEQLLNHNKLLIKHKIGHTLLSYNEIEKIYQLEHEC
jgi:hypothetical protein